MALLFSHFLKSLVSIASLLYLARLLPHSFQQQLRLMLSSKYSTGITQEKLAVLGRPEAQLLAQMVFCHKDLSLVFIWTLYHVKQKTKIHIL